jgi:hypothetical protein
VLDDRHGIVVLRQKHPARRPSRRTPSGTQETGGWFRSGPTGSSPSLHTTWTGDGDGDGVAEPFAVVVLATTANRITRISLFACRGLFGRD